MTKGPPWGAEILDSGAADGIMEALAEARHLPLSWGYGLPRERVCEWHASRFVEAAGDGSDGRVGVVARDGDGRIRGGLILEKRPWESGIFGLQMARIPGGFLLESGDTHRDWRTASAMLSRAREVLAGWEVRHCSALVPAEETALLFAFNEDAWLLVDSTLEMAWRSDDTRPETHDAVRLRPVREEDREPLEALARDAFTRTIRSRYTADPWLPPEGTADLYAGWLQKACDGEFGDVVVVAEVDGRPSGFNTFKLDRGLSRAVGEGFASHGIAAVRPECRGMGLQPSMLHWLSRWQDRRAGGFNRGRVLTSNYAMQRACLKTGARITQAYHGLHTLIGGRPGSRTKPGGELREET